MLNIIGNFGGLLRAAVGAIADWQQRRRAFAELSSLDDRSLADIGITRSEIPYVLSHAPTTPQMGGAAAPANNNFQHAA